MNIASLRLSINGVDRSRGIEAFTTDVRTILRPLFLGGRLKREVLEQVVANCEAGNMDDHIVVDEQNLYKISVFFWPPGFYNAPHVHKTWAVAGVLHNVVTIKTYDMNHFSRKNEFVLNNTFVATENRIGRVIPPCLHRVGNDTAGASISLHVVGLSELAEERASDTVWYRKEGGRFVEFEPRDIPAPEFYAIKEKQVRYRYLVAEELLRRGS